jgi:hypothetical protein
MEASGKNHKTQSKGMVIEHVKLLDDLNELRRVQHKLDLEYRSNTSLGKRGQSAT